MLASGGFFITLFDKDTLKLYLNKGIYGFHMPPVFGDIGRRSKHYAALADYGCSRKGMHVFFFLKREIIYGGQILGNDLYGSFFLNGNYSPLGKKARATLFWDESQRACYSRTEHPGIFIRPGKNSHQVCQPYILRFFDDLGLAGKTISSDQLYYNIGQFPFPLPTNAISGMSFCTMTPFETRIAIRLIKNESQRRYEFSNHNEIEIIGNATPFNPSQGIERIELVDNEAHMEASILANPELLSEDLRPDQETIICRQIPISPFKPFQMDRADICYYKDSFAQGALPYKVLELKNVKAGRKECEQIERYLNWLKKCSPDEWKSIKIFLLAPGFKRTAKVCGEFRENAFLVNIATST
jgi:hypothetical protein